MIGRAAVIAVALTLVSGCPKSPGPVELTATWPTKTRSYADVERDWTRSGELIGHFDKLLEVHATFKSPEWRAAWVERQARALALPDAERAALLEQQKAEDADHYEVLLVMSTYEGRENDLQKGERSVWRVALIDDRGNQVTPSSIKRDRRPDDVIRADHPLMNDFADAYIIKFPRTIDVLREGARKFSLRIAGARGAVEVSWPAR